MRNVIFILISYLLLCVPNLYAAEDKADWWQIQKDLTNKLWNSNIDITELVKNVNSVSPKNAREAMNKLSLMLRTGMDKEGVQTLRELKALYPEIDNSQIESIYYDAVDNYQAWDFAKATVEVFAENISQIDLSYRLINYLKSSGWSVRKIDDWLADKPKGKNNFWIKERLAFNVKHKQGDKLIKELSDNVRDNPQDIENTIAFLDALIYARNNNEIWDLSWMSEVIKPKLITQDESLASKLYQLSQWSTAEVFYQYALDMELSEDEVRQLSMSYQAFVPDEIMRAGFKVKVREDMSNCLLKLDQKDQAQKWMEEAANIREEYDLGLNSVFAGQVQAASGQRVIEGRILENEEISENEPQYWSERAGYYRGRKEAAQEEYALKKGLALTKPKIEQEGAFKRSMDLRSSLLNSYASFLKRQNRSKDAVDLLLKEISEAPANSESAIQAARLLAYDFEKLVSVNDEVLWTWLKNRTKWEYPEERLIWRMLENAVPAERAFERRISENDISEILDKNLSRAEKLAFENDPTRACTLGWIENRMGFPKRSIALLEYACENANDEGLKEKSAFNLLESYLDTGNWKNADEIFSEAAKRLTYKEIPDWYARVALAAARSGATRDAMRIWKRFANINPARFDWLDDIAEYGLKDELIDFYGQMQEKMPSSQVLARAMEILEK
jgi:hypothetical protein